MTRAGGVNSWVRQQPPWSDSPLLCSPTNTPQRRPMHTGCTCLEDLGNVSLLERPLGAVTMVSTVAAALRARRRQYEVRHHLLERENTAVQLEGLVEARTAQLQQANEAASSTDQ